MEKIKQIEVDYKRFYRDQDINELAKEYHNNIKRIKEIMDDYTRLVEEHHDHLSLMTYVLLTDKPKIFYDLIKDMEDKFDINVYYKVRDRARESYLRLQSAINSYNYLIDTIIKDEKNYKEVKEEKNKEPDVIEGTLLEMDDTKLFNYLDDVMASQDLSVLKKAREQLIQNGEEHDLIDKAIAERKRRDRIELERQIRENLRKQKIESKRRKRNRKMMRRAIFSGILSGLLGSSKSSNPDIMPWEQDYIDKKEYEPFQFEEEELEEDDFYNEDD